MALFEGYRGNKAESLRRLSMIEPHLRGADQPGSHYYVAAVYAALGRPDEAFSWLEEARRSHDEEIVFLKVDPLFLPLRGDPRFATLLKEMKLPA